MAVKDRMKEFALMGLSFVMEHIHVILSLSYLATLCFSGKNSCDLLDNIAKYGEIFGESSTTNSNTGKKKDTERK
ncbi:MAG: hypothetical protein IJQ58_07405 [Synergistaceae bacterium]|nr:hypothetical protein [Synergistaceae bacterium]